MSDESDAPTKAIDINQPLSTLGKYQIERKLGQGGMGTVYLARNTDLKKLVALKVLPRDKAKNPILVRRFKAEAQAAGQLEHPNIVSVYDTGEADGFLYIAMRVQQAYRVAFLGFSNALRHFHRCVVQAH